MNKYPWFRLYTESRNDSKLDALNDREFRIWHKLLCLAAESEERGTVDYIDPEFIAMELRLNADELDSAISRMIRLRLVERSESKVIFKSFAARQYDKPSDRPEATKERQRRARQNARDGVTPVSRDVTRRTEQNRLEKNIGGVGDVDNSTDPVRLADILAETKKRLAQEAAKHEATS